MKNSQAKRLSEELLNVDQKTVADAFEIDDAKKLKQYTKLKTNEAKKPFYITATFKRATAIAACLAIVAVTAFALTNKTNNNISSNNNANSNNNSQTSSQNKKVIYVTGDTSDNYDDKSSSSLYLNKKYISPALQEKMDLYKDYTDAEVVFKVVVKIFVAFEDNKEAGKIADAHKEAQTLYEQQEAAYLEEQKARAEYSAFYEANPGNEPELIAERERMFAIIKEKEEKHDVIWSKWSNLRLEIKYKYFRQVIAERLEFLKQFGEKEPVTTSYNKSAYYVDLTAEEINILAEKGGYTFKFASGDIFAADKNN